MGRSKSCFPGLSGDGAIATVVLAVALFILTFIVQPFRIPSESMEHTLLVGDFLLVKNVQRFRRRGRGDG